MPDLILPKADKQRIVQPSTQPTEQPPIIKRSSEGLKLSFRPDALTLIPIRDRVAPDWCEVCGRESGLFWNGRYVSCIDCARDAKLLRAAGIIGPNKAKTPQEFLHWLVSTKNNVIGRL